jgi:hypothetical protein
VKSIERLAANLGIVASSIQNRNSGGWTDVANCDLSAIEETSLPLAEPVKRLSRFQGAPENQVLGCAELRASYRQKRLSRSDLAWIMTSAQQI